MRALAVVLLLATSSLANENLEADVKEFLLHYRVYVDGGYTHSSTRPGNHLWRSKVTTHRIDRPVLNLAVANLWKEATAESRWGFEFGLQAGDDTELAVPDPGSGNKPVKNTDVLRYFHRASATYLFPLGKGLEVTGGLIPGFPGYESFLSIENATYTRGYITDYVPYFLFGLRTSYPATPSLDLSLFLVTGWDYLVDANDVPSLGFQAAWSVTERLTFTQNFYWGAEQADTSVEFWRFFSDSILEYRTGPLVFAFAFDIGTEKQASAGTPRSDWLATALWVKWEIGEHWSLGCRPEIFHDPDGLLTSSQQRIRAVSLALKYRFTPAEAHSFALSLEYRYDRSTGAEGGFFSGSGNTLVPDQHLIMVALTWSFSR
ncbi:MAG: outer membrane beta-barrel protein [Planctomycetota bacterium]|jgi:hypothetical protein